MLQQHCKCLAFVVRIMLGARRLLATLIQCAAAAAKTQAKIKEVENEARSMVTTQVQANKLPTEEKLLQLELHAKQAQQAQRDAEERAQRAEADTHQH